MGSVRDISVIKEHVFQRSLTVHICNIARGWVSLTDAIIMVLCSQFSGGEGVGRGRRRVCVGKVGWGSSGGVGVGGKGGREFTNRI